MADSHQEDSHCLLYYLSEKKDLIAYIKHSAETPGPSGFPLGGLGPVTEGLFLWIGGIVALVAAALWIGSRQ